MKNIRSKYVKDSLLDYSSLVKSLQENTTEAVRDLLDEKVRDTYNKILSESEDDYDEEEMEDTDSENIDTTGDDTVTTDDSSTEETSTEVTPDGAVEKTTEGSDGEGNEWSEFEKYKVSDDQYDFSNAEDEEIVRAYKLMKDEDQLIVTKDGDKIHLQDNETGADYIIDLQSVPAEEEVNKDVDKAEDVTEDTIDGVEKTEEPESGDDFDGIEYEIYQDDDEDGNGDDENDNEDKNNMNEQRIFEIALNEYDSNVGYTDNYQKKDVMTNPGMSEPAKSGSVNDWDKGVPHGDEKPWSGRKPKRDDKPFTAGKGTTIEEEFNECGDMFQEEEGDYGEVSDAPVEEATNVGGFVQQNSTSKSHVPNSNGRSARSASKGGKRIKGTATPRYSGSEEDTVSESMMKKVNSILDENKQLKKMLNEFRTTLNEAAVTNVNLGKIIKLISENATTSDEKREIIARFGKEAKTIGASNALYESISNELNKKNKMDINEEKQFTANSSKMINETQIYKSKDLMESLDMMHKICKI